jgi:phosphorylcholine metabolism protein LicD
MCRRAAERIPRQRIDDFSTFRAEFSKFKKVWQENNQIKYDFVLTEIDLALTFFRIARSPEDRAKIDRNLRHARSARKSAIRFLEEVPLTQQREAMLREKLQELDRLYPRENLCL